MAYSLCSQSVENLGEQECDKSRGVGRKIFIYNGTMLASEVVDPVAFLDALVAKSKLSKNNPEKVFVINEIQDITDGSEQNKTASLNLGFSAVLQEGKPIYTIKVFAGGDLLKRYRKFNNQNVRIIELDANGVFWMYAVGTGAKGFKAKCFFTGNKLSTGQGVEEGVCTLTLSILSTSEYIDNAKWVDVDGNVEDVQALIDVNLKFISKASNVYKIGLEIAGSNLSGPYNIYDLYGDEIVTLPFTAGTGVNYGTPLAITSKVLDPTTKSIAFTFDSTTFGVLPAGALIKLFPPSPTLLLAGGVAETELIPVILTK